MNIKEHIEAGHYPVDDRGRAIVPTRGGATAIIAVLDSPNPQQLVGWILGETWGHNWYADGHWNEGRRPHHRDLFPPPPRKVKASCWGLFYNGVPQACHATEKAARAAADQRGKMWQQTPTVVELTGEYEEPWP